MHRGLAILAALLFWVNAVAASEIREFNISTIERLGNELIHASQRPDRGASGPAQLRALESAKAALRGRLFDVGYNYVVLNDPDGNGFLVYALVSTGRKGEAAIGGHFRATVTADGQKVERIDALSRTLMIEDKSSNGLPNGYRKTASYINQIVSNKPVETFIYASALLNEPIFVGTPDGKIWRVESGRVSIDRSKPGNNSDSAAVHKAFGQ